MKNYAVPVGFAVSFAALAFFATTWMQSSVSYMTGACVVAALCGAVCGYLLSSWKKSGSGLFTSGFFFLLAVLCGLVFVGVNDTAWNNDRKLIWQIGSASLGGLAIVLALYKARKRQ